MGFDELIKGQNFHRPRPTGIDQAPLIENVVGVGSQYDQSWKTGNGENWSDRSGAVPKTNAYGEAFKRRKD
jgi:hypothetical protein